MDKDPGALIQIGLQLAVVMLEASDAAASDLLAQLERAAAECARSAVPIETVQRAIREGISGMIEHFPRDPDRAELTVHDADVVQVLDVLSSAVSRGYMDEVRRNS
ncbi:hypothetical protein BJY24_006397 [Nocardia transvalensis]|uniref:RsbT co-antagonist protein RsbRD N-terminal domain-containing protein n=1 Tax=Nocardia transvalensis TaxID=37333 RepID=A0A7W9PKC9_9NOCA|nr:hypothetical protein [Nocardia transvalensis]MBB5917485.1 hypothetical protein [Nocardia transvalensis]